VFKTKLDTRGFFLIVCFFKLKLVLIAYKSRVKIRLLKVLTLQPSSKNRKLKFFGLKQLYLNFFFNCSVQPEAEGGLRLEVPEEAAHCGDPAAGARLLREEHPPLHQTQLYHTVII
jgi:hypothetical protein